MDNVTIVENCNDAAIADWLAARLGEALSASAGPVTITVPGGSTPFPIIEALLAHDLDWTRLVVWPGDDRVVPEDHAASNTGRLRDLFEPAGAEVVTLTEMEAVPPFALAWLGMGTDGHIASLFPNTDPRVDDPRRIVRLTPDPLPPEAPFDRISLTMPALLASAALLFVIRGEEKRAIFEQALVGKHDFPVARLLGAAKQPVTCFT
ncbi:MAG: 6-phosphogluconolactonase [Erythrobacter sp.]|jgi:6-phosphogluconolactonase|uniref:6-phosphogluconolactonase n=1 Tax=Qipengyuania citrea TaxID=225971 RepID=UPI0020A19B42|nr:6-phosphogluconolactonase [Qipengyuania citrea]MCP2017384.1 6-phosphogluconolactonase [Qipengyuania citrea]MDE0901486.1 6-phosphogluconolactonase [Erythrobacter sp.]